MTKLEKAILEAVAIGAGEQAGCNDNDKKTARSLIQQAEGATDDVTLVALRSRIIKIIAYGGE